MIFNKEEINILKNLSKINDQCFIYPNRFEVISPNLDCLGIYEFEEKQCKILPIYSLKNILKPLKPEIELTYDDEFIYVENYKFKIIELNIEKDISSQKVESFDLDLIIPSEDLTKIITYSKKTEHSDLIIKTYKDEYTITFGDTTIKLNSINELKENEIKLNLKNFKYIYNKFNTDSNLKINLNNYYKIELNKLSYYFTI